MNIVRAAEAKRYENAETCIAFEYPTGSKEIDIARVEVRGRYPLEGSAINKEVTELVYVEKGAGRVCVNDEVLSLGARDVILIEKDQRVWWEGNLDLVISCAPAWTKEQYEPAAR